MCNACWLKKNVQVASVLSWTVMAACVFFISLFWRERGILMFFSIDSFVPFCSYLLVLSIRLELHTSCKVNQVNTIFVLTYM